MNYFLYLFGGFGMGSLIVIVVQHFLENDRRRQERLFEARRIAYKDVIGKLDNLFLDKDEISCDRQVREQFINLFFGEILLLCGIQLRKLIKEYKTTFNQFISLCHWFADNKKSLNDENDHSTKIRKLQGEIINLSEKIEIEIRKELGIK